MKMGIRNQKGFTLIEIIISLAIIGILAIGFLTLFTSAMSWIYFAGHRNADNFQAQGAIAHNIIQKDSDNTDSLELRFSDGGPSIVIDVSGGSSTVGNLTVFVPGGTIPVPTPVTGVTLNTSALTIAVGQQVQLIATVSPTNAANKDVTWSSSNSSVVTVNSEGLITAGMAEGTATVTARTVDGGFEASCNITVQPLKYFSFLSNGDFIKINGVLFNKYDGNKLIRYPGLIEPKTWEQRSNALTEYQSSGEIPSAFMPLDFQLLTRDAAQALPINIKNNNEAWWTATSHSTNQAFYITASGGVDQQQKTNALKIRPVVTITGTPHFYGQGTFANPYLWYDE